MKPFNLLKKQGYITVFTSLITITGNAQSIKNIGSVSTNSYNTYNEFGPFRTVPAALTSTPISNRHAYLYPKTTLTGIEKEATIDSISFFKKYFGEIMYTANLKIHLKNTNDADLGTGSLDWAVATNSALKVFDKNPATEISGDEGVKVFKFIEPFTYTGENIILFIEYYQQGPTHDYASWYYDNTTVSYGNNTVKYADNATITPPNSLTRSSTIHPVTRLFYTPPPALPLLQADFWARQNTISNEIHFKTIDEHEILNIQLEKSTDGINFKTVEAALPKNETGTHTYSFVDHERLRSKIWYRIKITDKNNRITYSKVILLQDENSKTKVLNLFPNPAKNDLQISLNNLTAGKASLQILNTAGVQVWQKNIDTLNHNYNTTVNIEKLAVGNYYMVITNGSYTSKVSFVKL